MAAARAAALGPPDKGVGRDFAFQLDNLTEFGDLLLIAKSLREIYFLKQ